MYFILVFLLFEAVNAIYSPLLNYILFDPILYQLFIINISLFIKRIKF